MMIVAKTISQDEEKELLAEWFATVSFPDAEFEDGDIPSLDPEEDDEESRSVPVETEDKILSDINMETLLEELRKRDPDNPF